MAKIPPAGSPPPSSDSSRQNTKFPKGFSKTLDKIKGLSPSSYSPSDIRAKKSKFSSTFPVASKAIVKKVSSCFFHSVLGKK